VKENFWRNALVAGIISIPFSIISTFLADYIKKKRDERLKLKSKIVFVKKETLKKSTDKFRFLPIIVVLFYLFLALFYIVVSSLIGEHLYSFRVLLFFGGMGIVMGVASKFNPIGVVGILGLYLIGSVIYILMKSPQSSYIISHATKNVVEWLYIITLFGLSLGGVGYSYKKGD